ncbi:MAG: hypothetical protein AB7F86_18090 [Bdellovibrionales bacterium]
MAVLIRLVLLLSLTASTSFASYDEDMPEARRQALKEQEEKSCSSTTEYIKTLTFLRGNMDFVITETAARQVADRVSKGCNGASDRFSKTLVMLKKIGVSDRKALEMAFDFSKMPDYVLKNFLEIFTKSFLAEFFDYDYSTAMALAFELSKNYKGDARQVREDFLELVRFCKDGQNLDLPTKLCAEYTVRLARLSQYYSSGVRQPFYRVYQALRDREEFGLDIKTALDLSYNVLTGGPKAIDNFFAAFEFATKKEGLSYTQEKAMKFALKMAKRSYVGSEPVIIPGFETPVNRAIASEEPVEKDEAKKNEVEDVDEEFNDK